MSTTLSNRQRKNADRVGGIELMIRWPDELMEPGMLDDNSERDATDKERTWVEVNVQPECQRHGLVAVRASVARDAAPSASGGGQQTRLAVVIIGRRWVHAKGTGHPKTMWHEYAVSTDDSSQENQVS